MALPVYLALTEAEFRLPTRKPARLAWMGIRFTENGTLVGFPEVFPAGGILTVNDSSPLPEKCPPEAIKILQQWVEQFRPSAVLMDMQRSGAAPEVLKALASSLPCPVAVSAPYAHVLSGPVLLPPVPLYRDPEKFLAPWAGREIWLEISPLGQVVRLTKTGRDIRFAPVSPVQKEFPGPCSRYTIRKGPDFIEFRFRRTSEGTAALFATAEKHGVTRLFGLYLEYR